MDKEDNLFRELISNEKENLKEFMAIIEKLNKEDGDVVQIEYKFSTS